MKNQSFHKRERLRKRGEIRRTRDSAGSAGRLMTVYCAEAPGVYSRLAVVVNRAVGCAVIRNRVKRRLREIFRRNKYRFTRAVDVVIRARPAIRDADYQDLQNEYIRLLEARRVFDALAASPPEREG